MRERASERMQREIEAMSDRDSRASAQAWQQRFIEAARRRLTTESFTAIMEEATDASE